MLRPLLSLLVAAWLVAPVVGQVTLPASLSDAAFGPLQSGVTYVTTSNVTVSGPLTIEPGAVIKVALNAAITLNAPVTAGGDPSDPVVITSVRDDSVGVVVDAAPPAPGDWRQLVCNTASAASSLVGVELRFAGRNGLAGLFFGSDADLVLQDLLVRDGGGPGLNGGANSTQAAGGSPQLIDCRFEDNLGVAALGLRLRALAGFSGLSASGNLGGDVLVVRNGATLGDLTLTADNLIDGLLVMNDHLVVSVGDTLTLGPGLTLRFGRTVQNLKTNGQVRGPLVVQGTPAEPVLFTSLEDDTAGGDVLVDGPTTGAPGDWGGVTLFSTSGASDVAGLAVRFGGAFQNAGLVVDGVSPALSGVTVSDSLTDGLNVTSGGTPSVRDSRFDDNLGRAVNGLPWGTLGGFLDNTASGNAQGDLTRCLGGTVDSGASRVDRWNSLNGDGVLVVENRTVVRDLAALTLGAGLVLKFEDPVDSGFLCEDGELVFDGRGYAKVVLTALADDAFGGDTNGDGAASAPGPGAWGGVTYLAQARPGSMDHVLLRFPGQLVNAGVTFFAELVSIDNVRVDQSSKDGFRFHADQFGRRNLVAFANQGDGIVLDGGVQGLIHATVAANDGRGIVSQGGNTGGIKSVIAWFNGVNAASNIVGFGDHPLVDPPRVFTSNGSPVWDGFQGNILADPLFFDPDSGDLSLGLFSPCIQTAGPGFSFTFEDHDGRSRTLDHNLFGFSVSDMGAYEYAVYRTEMSGDARLGGSFTVQITGNPTQGFPPGTAFWFTGPGFDGTAQFFPSYGQLLIGGATGATYLFALNAATPFVVNVPDDPALLDISFGLQAVVQPTGNPGVGNWVRPFHATVRE